MDPQLLGQESKVVVEWTPSWLGWLGHDEVGQEERQDTAVLSVPASYIHEPSNRDPAENMVSIALYALIMQCVSSLANRDLPELKEDQKLRSNLITCHSPRDATSPAVFTNSAVG